MLSAVRLLAVLPSHICRLPLHTAESVPLPPPLVQVLLSALLPEKFGRTKLLNSATTLPTWCEEVSSSSP